MSKVESRSGDSLVWQPAGHPVRVVVRPRAAERMRREVLRHDGSTAGSESGGLLRGFIERDGIVTVTVEDIEPMAWSFSMAPADRRKLDASLKPKPGDRTGRSVVGYYRTHSGDDLDLNAGDIALIRVCFPDPANVFMLLKPGPGKDLSSRLFFWQGGVMRSEDGDHAHPFGQPVAAPAAPLLSLPHQEAPAAALRPARTPWVVAVAAVATAMLLFIPGRWYLPHSQQTPAAPPPTVRQLSLEVERRPSDLLVRWNGSAAAIRDSVRGVLEIQDGPYRRSWELNPDQLRTANIYYAPAGADIQFRLEVWSRSGEPVVEAVRMLSAGLLAGAAAPSPLPQAPDGPVVHASTARSFSPRQPVIQPVVRAESASSADRVDDSEPSLRPRTVHFNYRDQRPEEPPSGSDQQRPRPVRQVNPTVPRSVVPTGDVALGVKVFIDQAGRVTGAEVISRKGRVNSQLADSALSAARLWRFEPATRNGKPVASDAILDFHFPP
ncbi:MAG TPA: energy transducer TonB [Bryobacteraceae bacterium]|nr:energy transducer TonB [Bryobacteraceae bacterium]